MARPISVKPDETVLWDLGFLGFSDQHIANVIGCHQSLISRRTDFSRVIAQARAERSAAIVALWRRSSAGALRSEDRDDRLAEIVKAAEERKIRRSKPRDND